MVSLRMGSLLALSLCFVSTLGCASGLKDENAGLKKQNQELRDQLNRERSTAQNSPDPQQLQAMQRELAERDARIRELETKLRRPEPGDGSEPGISGIETHYDKKKGELTVNLPADILFAPGSAQLKKSSQATLDKIVAALKKDYAGKKVRVEGHTDKDPIVRSQDKWIDNLDLSLNRAAAVTRYLVEKHVDAKNIATTGYGETRPKASKAASRRVEIVVLVG